MKKNVVGQLIVTPSESPPKNSNVIYVNLYNPDGTPFTGGNSFLVLAEGEEVPPGTPPRTPIFVYEDDEIEPPEPGNPPSTPTNLSSSGVTQTSFQFSWNAASGADSYDWVIGNDAESSTNQTSVTVTSRTPNTSYTVRVRARNEFGASPWGSLNITTLPEETPEPSETFNVFGDSVPPSTLTWNSDGNVGDWVANQFYTYGTPPHTNLEIFGVRLWVPAGAPSNISGTSVGISKNGAGTGVGHNGENIGLEIMNNGSQTTMTGPLIPGQWNDIPMTNAYPLVHGDGIWAGVRVGDGRYYVHTNGAGLGSHYDSVNLPRFCLAESTGPRSWSTAGGIMPSSAVYYGIDLMIREV